MFDIFKKKEIETNKESYLEIACLLIHASKIDEDYSDKEKMIIKHTLESLGAKKMKLVKL